MNNHLICFEKTDAKIYIVVKQILHSKIRLFSVLYFYCFFLHGYISVLLPKYSSQNKERKSMLNKIRKSKIKEPLK